MNVTIENLAQVTEREVVETIAFHMLRQGKRSRDANTCVYRNSEGLSCAAGVLLSDEKAKEFEGLTWLSLVNKGAVPDAHAYKIRVLQYIHDMLAPKHWPAALVALFLDWGVGLSGLELVLEEVGQEGVLNELDDAVAPPPPETVWWSSSSGKLEVLYPLDVVKMMPLTGECGPSVDFILAMPEVAVQFALVSDEELSQELEDYGAWSNAELKDRKENIRRVLWLSLSELHDELESQ